MIYAAILGFGVVGSGVAEVLLLNSQQTKNTIGQSLVIKKILDIRDFPKSPFSHLLTKDPNDVFDDPDIRVIAETIGGATIAYEYTKRALMVGKSVVTSNKELVAKHGVELMQLANKNNCAYLFEASVGGGIPIIRPLHRCLAANRIDAIAGILNGTTNYILTRMEISGAGFEDALVEAQEKGYAEKNPQADVDGTDACRKIAILSTIALHGRYVDANHIYTEGIQNITQADIAYAKNMQGRVKLIAAFCHPHDEKITAIVAPHIISEYHPLAVTNGVFNAVIVEGNALGEVMFYGQGAGKLATASAVVGDMIDAALHMDRSVHITPWFYADEPVLADHNDAKVKALIRISSRVSHEEAMKHLKGFGTLRMDQVVVGEAAYTVGEEKALTERELCGIISELPGYISHIRLY